MNVLKTCSRTLSWLGILALAVLLLLLLQSLGRVLLTAHAYPAERVLLSLGPAVWLREEVGLPLLRMRAMLILLLWALPCGLGLLAFQRLSRHLASGELLRLGLSFPFRLLGWAMACAFVPMALANLPQRIFFFPLLSFRWIWLLRPSIFLLTALLCFLLARVIDEATRLRAEQDLVI